MNGYSGQFPDWWPVNDWVYNEDSVWKLALYAAEKELQNVYIYDVSLGQWAKLQQPNYPSEKY